MSEVSLRTVLFQRYTQLQVWLLSRIVWYAALFYVVTLVLFALLRLFTGISIKRIGYFSLRHIVLTPQQGIEVRIGKLGIAPHRPTVARPGFLSFVVSNLKIIVDPNVTIEEDMNPAPKSGDANDGGAAGDRSADSDAGSSQSAKDEAYSPPDESDPLLGFPLLPRRNKCLFKLARWAVTQMKVFDVHFHSVSFVFTDVTTLIFTSVNLRLDLRKTRNYNVSNFVGTLDTYKLSDGELPINAKLMVTDIYTAESLEDETPWQVFEDLRFDVSGVLNVDQMRAKEMGVQVHCGRVQFDIMYFTEMLQKVKDIRSVKSRAAPNGESFSSPLTPTDTEEKKDPKNGDRGSSQHKTKAKVLGPEDKKRLVHAAMLLLHLVHKVQLNVGIVEVLRLPVDAAFFAMRMKDMNVDLSRMNPQSSGFKLLYNEGDIAHQSIFTVASITAGIDTGNEQEEIFYIPLVTSLTRGNLFSQTLRFVQEDKQKNDSVMKSSWVFHSPNVSIEETQISTLVRVALGLDAQGRSRSSQRQSSGSMSPTDELGIDSDVPFQNLLPNMDLDLTINDPAFRLVCDNTESCQDAMFVMSSSRVHMALNSKHNSQTNSYSIAAVVETTGDRGYYHSETAHRVDIINSETTQLTVRANTLPSFHVEVDGKQSNLHITGLRHEIFCAIGQLHATIRKPIRKWTATHKPRRRSVVRPVEHGDIDEVAHKGSLRSLPFWLKRFSFKALNSSMAIATNQFRGRTSDILGIKLSSDSFTIDYRSKLSSEDLGESGKFVVSSPTDGRELLISGSGITLFKADHTFLEHCSDPSIALQHSVTQMPKLSVHVRTHNDNCATVDLDIEPRLRIDLNVNLILAFSVVREIIDKALLRHQKDDNDPVDVDELEQQIELERRAAKRRVMHEFHNITLTMPRALIKIDMPSDDQIMFELGATVVRKMALKNPEIHTRAIKIYSQHPFKRTSWCILASMNKVEAEYDLKAKPHVEDKIKLNVAGMRINVPYKFKLYRIIDNGITLAKAIRTLILQTKSMDWMIVLNPSQIEGVPNIPRIRLKTSQLQLSLEDDYFESDLSLVLLTKVSTGQLRRRKLYMFEARIKQMIREGVQALEMSKRAQQDSFDRQQNFQQNNSKSPQHSSTGFGEQFGDIDDKVADQMAHVASNVRKTATTVFEHFHDSQSSSPAAEDHKERQGERYSYYRALGQSLRHVSMEKLEELMSHGVELGCLADDGDPAFTKDHIWLEFWCSPEFKEFRKQRVPLHDGSLGKLTVSEAREALLKDFSRMWIDTIRRERGIQHLGAKKRRNEIFVDEFNPHTCAEESIVDYSQKPLLMSVDFRHLDLVIDRTTHDTPEKLHRFMYDVGKGQPLDSKFSILVPLFIDLRAHGGLKVDIKDYPLPVLHFPGLARSQDPRSNLALQIQGNFIISEQLFASDHNIRKIFVPLRPLMREEQKARSSDVIEVHRTLTPIKTFTDLKFHVGSSIPSRVCWCMAYKPGFHSVGESFSGFSKPPIDPSPSLGFWDKIRLVLHARFDFQLPKSPLCLFLKSGKSPYELLNDSSGFLFAWRDNVHVQINPDDDPKNLFVFNSDVFELLVPNYMNWEREFLHCSPAERALPRSGVPEKFPSSEKVVFSFAQRTKWQLGMMFEKPSKHKENTKNGVLESRDSDFRKHYEVNLCMPEYIKDVQNYDAYEGFRSDFIHMAISVVSRPVGGPDLGTGETNWNNQNDTARAAENKGANKCAAHLSLGVIRHFRYWKDQFNSEQWPPIKTGSLFPDPVRVRPSNKTFGTALSTAQYQIALSPLDLSFFHQMRHHVAAESHDRCTGLKAKIEDFVFDWHTRREPPVVTDENGEESYELDGHRRWRMKSNNAEVRLNAVQVRVIDAKLRTQSSKAALKALHDDDNSDSDIDDDFSETGSSSDGRSASYYGSRNGGGTTSGGSSSRHYGPRYVGDDYWIDLDDYTEIGKHRSLRSKLPEVHVFPFAYSPRFSYLRNTDFSGLAVYTNPKSNRKIPKFGNILVHDCLFTAEQPERRQADLLDTRRNYVVQQIGDFKASVESLESQGQVTSQVKQKIDTLKKYIAIGELNSKVLYDEMMRFYQIAEEADKKHNELQSKRHQDLKEQLESTSDSESVVQQYASEDPEYSSAFKQDSLGQDNWSLFRNRYIIHAMHLKWNNSVRNLVYRLQTTLSEDKEIDYVRCRRAVQYLEELVLKAEDMSVNDQSDSKEDETTTTSHGKDSKLHFPCGKKDKSKRRRPSTHDQEVRRGSDAWDDECNMRLKTLFDDLREVQDSEIAQKAHSVSFFTPRIQLVAEENPSKCLQVTARDIEVQVVDTFSKNGPTDNESSKIERRYGALLNKSGFYVISEEDVRQTGVESLCLERYSGDEEDNKESWPPWLAIEICYDPMPLKQFMIVNDVSFGIRYNQPNDLHVVSHSEENEDEEVDALKAAGDDDTVDNSLKSEAVKVATHKAEQAKLNAATLKTSRSHTEHSSERTETSGPSNGNTEHSDSIKQEPTNQSSISGVSDHLRKTLEHHGQHSGKALVSSLIVDAPRVAITVDSVQFYTFYTILVDLLTYRDPLIKRREEAIDRVFLSNDFRGDYRATLERIELLQKDIRNILFLRQRLQIVCMNQQETNREVKIHMIKLERECIRRMTQLTVVIRAFKAILRKNMNTGVEKLSKWSLLADSILLKVLSETGQPIVELYLRRVHYSRLSNADSESLNRATLAGVYGRNLLPNSTYPMILANYELGKYPTETKEAIKLRWTRLDRVGGIPVLDNAEVKLKPLHIQFEHGVFEKLLDFAFPISHVPDMKDEISSTDLDFSESDSSLSDSDSDSVSSLTLSEIDRDGGKSAAHGRGRNGLLNKIVKKKKKDRKGHTSDVEEMMHRASNYWSIRSLHIFPTQLTVSYKGKSKFSIFNLQNLEIPMPALIIANKTCSKLDLIMRIRKMAVKTLLAQTGSIIGNKFTRHKRHAAEDDRDLGLERLTSRSSRKSDMMEELEHELTHISWQSAHDSTIKSHHTTEDGSGTIHIDGNILVPVHRERAIADPENARTVAMDAITGNDSTRNAPSSSATSTRGGSHEFNRARSTGGRSGSLRSSSNNTIEPRSSFQSQWSRLSGHRRTFSGETSARDLPGSAHRLRRPEGESSDHRKRSPLSKSSTFIEKIKKGFN